MSGEASAQREKPLLKVVYVVASGRSGSTLVGNILGELKGFFHAGELRTLWGQGLVGGRLCGCGVPVRECEFWRGVLARTLDDDEGSGRDPVEVNRLHEELVRLRYLPRMLRYPRGRPPRQEDLQAYAETMEHLYLAIGAATGAHIIVDSSKHPPDGAVLRFFTNVEPYFLQLVRDPRAVAYSWQRHKSSPGERSREEMIRLTSTTSSRNWLIVNLAAEAVRKRAQAERSLLMRYESFMAQPASAIHTILDLVGEDPDGWPFVDDRHVRLMPGHTAGGNPDRFRTGLVSLREDTEWIAGQVFRDRLISTLIALPLLRRYGYSLVPGRRRNS